MKFMPEEFDENQLSNSSFRTCYSGGLDDLNTKYSTILCTRMKIPTEDMENSVKDKENTISVSRGQIKSFDDLTQTFVVKYPLTYTPSSTILSNLVPPYLTFYFVVPKLHYFTKNNKTIKSPIYQFPPFPFKWRLVYIYFILFYLFLQLSYYIIFF
jgi:hypothetical protein